MKYLKKYRSYLIKKSQGSQFAITYGHGNPKDTLARETGRVKVMDITFKAQWEIGDFMSQLFFTHSFTNEKNFSSFFLWLLLSTLLISCGETRKDSIQHEVIKDVVPPRNKNDVGNIRCKQEQKPCEIINGNQKISIFYNNDGKVERNVSTTFGSVETIEYQYNEKGLLDETVTSFAGSKRKEKNYYSDDGELQAIDQDINDDGIIDCRRRIDKKKQTDSIVTSDKTECDTDGKKSIRENLLHETYKKNGRIGNEDDLTTVSSEILVDGVEQSRSSSVYHVEALPDGGVVVKIDEIYSKNRRRIIIQSKNSRGELLDSSMDEGGDGVVDVSVKFIRDECGNIISEIQKEFVGNNEFNTIEKKYIYFCTR
jgi:hypothetical protein